MSIIEPKIDVLLDKTENDRFLLCAVASKRAQDINEMMRGQRNRAIQLQSCQCDIARAANRRPLSSCIRRDCKWRCFFCRRFDRRSESLVFITTNAEAWVLAVCQTQAFLYVSPHFAKESHV